MPTIIPAYGRDYTSAAEARADYAAGRDFILHDITSPWHGKPCSIRDLGTTNVFIRYNGLRKICTAETETN